MTNEQKNSTCLQFGWKYAVKRLRYRSIESWIAILSDRFF